MEEVPPWDVLDHWKLFTILIWMANGLHQKSCHIVWWIRLHRYDSLYKNKNCNVIWLPFSLLKFNNRFIFLSRKIIWEVLLKEVLYSILELAIYKNLILSWYHSLAVFNCHDATIFSSPVQSTGSELMSSPVWRRRPMLMFTFRSNVDKLLGPGWWNFTCEFVLDS